MSRISAEHRAKGGTGKAFACSVERHRSYCQAAARRVQPLGERREHCTYRLCVQSAYNILNRVMLVTLTNITASRTSPPCRL